MIIKVYVSSNTNKEGKDYLSYSAKINETKEFVNIRFSKKCDKLPEVNSKVTLENKDIFEVTKEGDHRRTFVIMKVASVEPLEQKIIEDNFFA